MRRLVLLAIMILTGLAGPATAQDCLELVGRWPYGATVRASLTKGNAYFGSGTSLLIADVTDPLHPETIGEVVLTGTVWGVSVVGAYAYVAVPEAGLFIVDVSTPSSPADVGFVAIQGEAFDVAVSGEFAYVAAQDDGLRVIDVSDPASPFEVGFLDTPGVAYGVVVSGPHVYLADGNGMQVVNVSSYPGKAMTSSRLGSHQT